MLPTGKRPGRAPEVEPPATAGRGAVAVAGRRSVAGRARTLRTLAVDLQPVPALAAGPGLAVAVDAAAGLCRCRRVDHLAGVGRLHDQPSPPTRRRSPPPSRTPRRTARSGTGRSRVGPFPWRLDHEDPPGLRARPRAAGAAVHRRAPRRQPAVRCRARPDPTHEQLSHPRRAVRRARASTRTVHVPQAPSLQPFLIRVPRLGPGRPRTRPDGAGRQGLLVSGQPCLPASPQPSPSSSIRPRTDSRKAPGAGGRRC
jgi:hypothetical protein